VRHRFARTVIILAAAAFLALPATPVPAYQSGTYHYHRGWVRHTVLEQFGITTTEVYVRGQYVQQTNRVQNMAFSNGYCYHSAFPWSVPRCYYYITHAAPSYERIDIVGEFHHFPNIDYQQHAYFRANSNDSWTKNCYFDHGALPILWRSECVGGRE
jgi:hypothetical protein